MSQFAIENGPVEIVSFPINNMVIFHSYVHVYQRVKCQNVGPIECRNIRQIECQKDCQINSMSEYMSTIMSDRLQDKMPASMSAD